MASRKAHDQERNFLTLDTVYQGTNYTLLCKVFNYHILPCHIIEASLYSKEIDSK